MKTKSANAIPLGKAMGHSREYNPAHLFPVPRQKAREVLGIQTDLPFFGVDIWNAYELSWLDNKGKPHAAIAEITIPCTTENIVESKSLKLYLNSFNQTRFESPEKVTAVMEKDISECVGGEITINLVPLSGFKGFPIQSPQGTCLDDLDIETNCYSVNPSFLSAEGERVRETLHSNLLRTNCPVTQQPDWATLIIDYAGTQIDHEGLLKYIVSFREHTGFHENCVERVFMDLKEKCRPEKLTVYARFTRRGGIDINPYRSSESASFENPRLARQ